MYLLVLKRLYHQFTRHLQGMLSQIPIDLIWAWVDEDVEQHTWYLASFVPNLLTTISVVIWSGAPGAHDVS